MIVRAGGTICLAHLLRCYLLCVVPSLYSAVFCTRFACVFGMLLCKEEGSYPLSLQLLIRGIWVYISCPCLCLCWVLGWGLC